MSAVMKGEPLTLALPKGRLMEQVREHFASRSLEFTFGNRELIAEDESGVFRIFLVKNSDLPVYVHHGIAGLGICGEDVLYESGHEFYRLARFSFGGTRMCIAGKEGTVLDPGERLTVATKFTRFTQMYFHERGIPVEIIKLNGSVELAPILGLAPFIVDLVETGNTLEANNLKILEKLKDIGVFFIANPAYYKVHFRRINTILDLVKG